jgi:hypothetical protein
MVRCDGLVDEGKVNDPVSGRGPGLQTLDISQVSPTDL